MRGWRWGSKLYKYLQEKCAFSRSVVCSLEVVIKFKLLQFTFYASKSSYRTVPFKYPHKYNWQTPFLGHPAAVLCQENL
jgi:hypothetical protein